MALRLRKFCASPSPRWRRPTWRAEIFNSLAAWTGLSDEELAKELVNCGVAEDNLNLDLARRLFARAIETPGGLRIQTLHAFSERLLRLFPFEANVPAHFKVADEREARHLLREARDEALGELEASPEKRAALGLVAREASASGFDSLLKEALSYAQTLHGFTDERAYGAALRGALGLAPGATSAAIEAEMLRGDIGCKQREEWAARLDTGTTHDRDFAARLRAANDDRARRTRPVSLLDAFFTQKKDKRGEGEPRGGKDGSLTTKGLRDRYPALAGDLREEQVRLAMLRKRRGAALTVERSEALFVVTKSIATVFARTKAERGVLDFANQIAEGRLPSSLGRARPGCSTSSTTGSIICCLTRPRTHQQPSGASLPG